MQVNLTADHRVIYGADGALFLKDLAYLIEETPERLSLWDINKLLDRYLAISFNTSP